MLKGFFKQLWRGLRSAQGAPAITANDTLPGAGGMQPDMRDALQTLLRAPLAHPRQMNYETVAWLMAAASSAEYLVQHMMGARNCERSALLLEFALAQCTVSGLILEFGVYRGKSLRSIARRVAQEVHGFDSFEGLPEDWTYFQKQGRFSLDGTVPHFDEPNIRIHKGWFERTLPAFLAEHPGPVRFVHVDCDLYSSTRTVLESIRSRVARGTVIVFDEYLNYPGWQQHEFRAFQEFVAQTGCEYRYLGFASTEYAVAIQFV